MHSSSNVTDDDSISGQEGNFKKYRHPEIDNLGTQYDYQSIMHYGRLSFTTNNKPTIQAIGNKDMELGQRDGLSDVDIIKLNALYDCKSESDFQNLSKPFITKDFYLIK